MRINALKNSIILKTAALSAFIMLAICLVFQMAPFGDGTFLTGDLNGQYINYFAQTRNAFIENNGMDYSLYKSLGGNMTGIIAYYAASPFVLLYVLINPVHYGTLTTFVVCAKVILMCCTMAFFLSKKLTSNSNKIILIALSYGFSGYVFVYMQNFMWHDVLILLPVICYGIDVLIETKKPYIYCITLAMAVFVNFYIAYMVCLFIILYFLYNIILMRKDKNKIGVILTRNLKISINKETTWHFLRFAAASLIGGLISACLLFPALANIKASKGIGLSAELYLTTEFSLVQFLARLLPFGFFHPNLVNDLPNVYAGTLTLILLLCFFAAKNIEKKHKIVAGSVLFVLFISMFSTDVMLVFHGFAPPVWFTHRHAFLFVFWGCYLAAIAFVKGKYNLKTLGFALLCMCVIFAARISFEEPVYTQNRLLFTLCIVFVLFTVLFYVNKTPKKAHKILCAVVICTVLCGEILVNTYYIQRQFELYPNSVYVQFVKDNTAVVNEAELANAKKSAEAEQSGGDFRIEKTYARSLNDSFLLNYYGVSHFGSTQDNNAADFLYNLGVIEGTAVLYNSEMTNIFADSILGIKYLMDDGEGVIPHGYVEVEEFDTNNITVYENPYVFPLAFLLPTENNDYNSEYTNKDTFTQNVYTALKHGDINDSLYLENGDINLDSLAQLSAQIRENSADVDFLRGEVNASVTAKESALLFMSIPYSESLNITVNGKKVLPEIVFNSQLGVPVQEGENIITITYDTPGKAAGIAVSIFSSALLLLWFGYKFSKRGHKNVSKT